MTLVALIVARDVANQRAQRPRRVAIVQRLLPRVRLAHVVAQCGWLRIARTAIQPGTANRPFAHAAFLAHQKSDALALQLQRV